MSFQNQPGGSLLGAVLCLYSVRGVTHCQLAEGVAEVALEGAEGRGETDLSEESTNHALNKQREPSGPLILDCVDYVKKKRRRKRNKQTPIFSLNVNKNNTQAV